MYIIEIIELPRTKYYSVSAKLTRKEDQDLNKFAKEQGQTISLFLRESIGVNMAMITFQKDNLRTEIQKAVDRTWDNDASKYEHTFSALLDPIMNKKGELRPKFKTLSADLDDKILPFLSLLEKKKAGRPRIHPKKEKSNKKVGRPRIHPKKLES